MSENPTLVNAENLNGGLRPVGCPSWTVIRRDASEGVGIQLSAQSEPGTAAQAARAVRSSGRWIARSASGGEAKEPSEGLRPGPRRSGPAPAHPQSTIRPSPVSVLNFCRLYENLANYGFGVKGRGSREREGFS